MQCSARRFLLRLALFFLLISAPILAQQNTAGSIIGKITMANGNFPGERVEVKLETRGSQVAATYADNEGRFNFSDLPSNFYHVVVNDSNYQPVRIDAVVNPPTSTIAFVNIRLVLRDASSSKPARELQGGNSYLVDLADFKKHYPKAALKAFDAGLNDDHQGKIDDSIKDFQKCLGIAPNFYPARNNLGSAYLKKSDFSAAAAQFQEVIKLRPLDAAAYFNLGNVYLLTRRYPEAQTTVQEGLKKQPNAALGRFLLGTIYARTGKPHEAEAMLNDALAADPTMANVYLELVNLYLQQNMKPRAVAELKTFLSQFPQDPMAPNARAVLERLQGASGGRL